MISPATDTTAAYDTVTFTATVLDSAGLTISDAALVWSSSDTSRAQVGPTGTVVAQSTGQAVIRASVGAVFGTATLTILPPRIARVVILADNGGSAPDTVIPLHATENYRVLAFDAKGKAMIVPSAASWQSSASGVISAVSRSPLILNGGRVAAEMTGSALITATLGGVTSAAITVTGFSMPPLTSLTAGGIHTCGIASDSAAYCWGGNILGTLGDGTENNRDGPVLVLGGYHWARIAAGFAHTCGLTGNGAAYCWGLNTNGQLGIGSLTPSSTPLPVQGGLLFSTIAAGGDYTCGITLTQEAYCWGGNGAGQLGTGDSVAHTTPAQVQGGLAFQSIGASPFSVSSVAVTCGVASTGDGYCWGTNADGQLGVGDSAAAALPRLVSGQHLWNALSPGDYHVCGVTTTGSSLCWGANPYGAFGDGSLVSSPFPTPVSGGPYAAASAGYLFGCWIAQGATLLCAGLNESYQLGFVSPSQLETPGNPAPGLQFSSTTTGGTHACGLSTTGVAYCWGLNEATGADTLLTVTTPRKVVGQP